MTRDISPKLSALIQLLKRGGKPSTDPFSANHFDLRAHIAQHDAEDEDYGAVAIATAQWERNKCIKESLPYD